MTNVLGESCTIVVDKRTSGKSNHNVNVCVCKSNNKVHDIKRVVVLRVVRKSIVLVL
jgi:hypothetical protein